MNRVPYKWVATPEVNAPKHDFAFIAQILWNINFIFKFIDEFQECAVR